MSWQPEIGDLFYAHCRISYARIVDDGFTSTAVKVRDRSYQYSIFRMVAIDHQTWVADLVHGLMLGSRVMLRRADFEASPVGPDVAAALGIAATQAREGEEG